MGNPLVLRATNGRIPLSALISTGAKGDPGNADNKADLVDGLVPLDQLPASQVAEASKLAQYDGDSLLYVLRGGVLERVATKAEVDELIETVTINPKVLAKVGALEYAPASALTLNTDGTTYTPIPDIVIADAASDEGYAVYPVFHYSGPGGLKIRRKANGSAVTNLLGFPSFEDGTATGWSKTGGVDIDVDNVDSRSGTYSLKATVTATSSGQQIFSPWCTHEQAIKASMAGYIKRISSTIRTVRIDGQYGDSAGNVLGNFTGINTTPGTDWLTRGIADATHLGGGSGSQVAPSGTTKTRLRWTIVSPSSGDIFRLDDAQVERADNVPAWGSTGGSGGALSMNGFWFPDVLVAQAAGVTPAGVSFATTGAKALGGFFKVGVGGTGLTGQRVEWEAAVATPGQATSISWASLDYARVRVAA